MSSISSTEPETGSISGLDYLSALLLRWRTLVTLPIAAAVLAIAVSFLLPRMWTAKVAFLPVSSSSGSVGSALSSLAGQLGVQVPGDTPSDDPEFYVALIKSHGLMDDVLQTSFSDPMTGQPRPLLDILDIDGDRLEARLEAGRDALNNLVSAQSDRATKVVTLAVRAPDPTLAAAIANRFVALLNKFNLEQRGSQAGASRRFVEQRMAEADSELRDAEDALRAFRTRNRRADTPELQFEDGRLQRQVQLRQDVYLGLRREYESARIQEVNDTPVLTIVDSALVPVKPSSPRRGRLGAVALALGLLAAIGLVVGQAVVADLERARDPAWSRVRSAWAQMSNDIGRLARRRAR